MAVSKFERRRRIKKGIRKKISGNSERPRLTVFRSNNEIYAQLIDDEEAKTLASASSRDKGVQKEGNKSDIATIVGENLAQKAVEAGYERVAFDRNGYRFHGRVKALADGARKGGLKF